MFVGIFIDAAVILFITWLFLRESAPEYLDLLYVALGLTAVNFGLAFTLGRVIGLWVIVPMTIVAFFAFSLFCSLPFRNAAIAALLFMVYKVGITLLVIH